MLLSVALCRDSSLGQVQGANYTASGIPVPDGASVPEHRKATAGTLENETALVTTVAARLEDPCRSLLRSALSLEAAGASGTAQPRVLAGEPGDGNDVGGAGERDHAGQHGHRRSQLWRLVSARWRRVTRRRGRGPWRR